MKFIKNVKYFVKINFISVSLAMITFPNKITLYYSKYKNTTLLNLLNLSIINKLQEITLIKHKQGKV